MAEFKYQEPFPIQKDNTEYRLLTKDYVKTIEVEGRKILKIQKEGLELLAREAYADVSFYLRASHLQKLANILKDPEASDNDKFVAHTRLMTKWFPPKANFPPAKTRVQPSLSVRKAKTCGLTVMMRKPSAREFSKPIGIVTCVILK